MKRSIKKLLTALDVGLTICARYPDSTLTDEEREIKQKARAFFEAMKADR